MKSNKFSFHMLWKYMGYFVAVILIFIILIDFEMLVVLAETENVGKKPIVIDVRSSNTSESINNQLCIVDGVIRHLHSENDKKKLSLNGKHEIRPINSFKSSHLESSSFNMKRQDDSLRVNLLTAVVGSKYGEFLGTTVASLDDFNGDGYNDYLIGSEAGWSYLFFGKDTINTAPDFTYIIGDVVASAGDVNGDGYSDVAIGAPDAGISESGMVTISFGGPLLGEYITFYGKQKNQHFGWIIDSLGDTNGDGYDDIIVGTLKSFVVGEAYVFFGGSPMDTIPDIVLRGETNSDYFGSTVASAGDLNGDGYQDIIVGNGQFRVEKAYIYWGGSPLDSIPDLIVSGPIDSDFGWNVGSAGDINGDGYDDAMVSAHWYTPIPGTTPPAYGRVYIYYGGINMDNKPDAIIEGTAPRATFGLKFSTLGDINFDGFDDIVVSAHATRFEDRIGKARIFLGGLTVATFDTLANLVLSGEEAEDWFSYALDGKHDLNGNGANELLIGAPFYPDPGVLKGKVYIYSIISDRKGDVNKDGFINVIDVMIIVKIITAIHDPTIYQKWSSDMNGDSCINILDIVIMVKMIIRM